jgi:hypothetical protein
MKVLDVVKVGEALDQGMYQVALELINRTRDEQTACELLMGQGVSHEV